MTKENERPEIKIKEVEILSEKVLATYFGENDAVKPEWKDDKEKELFWFYDDLHCPNPISPLYFSCNGWWGPTCEYMYRRFGAPIGSEWLGKKIGGYVYSAVVPPKTKAEQVNSLFTYYMSVMPVYAEEFYERWRTEYIPEIKGYWAKMLDFDFENSTIPQALIHMEDCLDMQERAFKIHWIINLAQFKASSDFVDYYAELFGGVDDEVGKINVSTDDRNWDSLRELYGMKQFVKLHPDLRAMFEANDKEAIMAKLDETKEGVEFKNMLNDYRKEYGFHALYTHEYIYKTIYEDPSPIIDTIKDYLKSDYDFDDHFETCRKEQQAAIDRMFEKIDDPEKEEKMRHLLHLCVQMAPITPDHHFYLDQGIFSHVRLMFLEIGKMYVKAGILDDPEDIFMLEYEDVRCAGVDPEYPAKEIVAKNRADMAEAKKRNPREWYGTATQWQIYDEPYKSLWGYPQKFEAEQEELKSNKEISKTVLKGIPGYPGVYEGTARFITDPKELDDVKKGEVLVCKMTNPAWVVCFSQIGALVTDTGGALSHPAVVSREFGIPCVVGTRRATQLIKTGDKVRVDGTTGTVEIIG